MDWRHRLGYGIGPWFVAEGATRRRRLIALGLAMLALYVVLRTINLYGDQPWTMQADLLRTMMSVLNLTKDQPSADFLLATLGVGALLLAGLEGAPSRLVGILAVFGHAPLFFYLTHLYGLHLLNLAALAVFGANQCEVFSVPNVGWIWLLAFAVAIPSWSPADGSPGSNAAARNGG